jgi:23S rRNA (uracil1939-C5)-methyltransferase
MQNMSFLTPARARILVEAQELGDGGEGVCYAQGQSGENGSQPLSGIGRGAIRIHVPGLLPGERAQVEVEHVSPHRPEARKDARKDAWGRVVRRLNAAPERVLPACAAYGRCGGCVLQHFGYKEQLRWKQLQVAAALKVPLLENPGAKLEEIVSLSPPLGYRSRVKLVAQKDRSSGKIRLGAFAPRSHELIDMAGCQVNLPSLTALACSVGNAATRLGLSCYDEARGSGSLRYLLLRQTQRGAQQLSLVVADSFADPKLAELLDEVLAAHPGLKSCVLHRNDSRGNVLFGKSSGTNSGEDSQAGAEQGDATLDRVLYGDPYVWEDIGAVSLRVSARSFLQVNRAVAAGIYSAVAAYVPEGARVLDLYCGVGGMGLAVLTQIPRTRLLGVEANPHAVADAVASARAASLPPERARFLCGDAARSLPAAGEMDVLLLNPPRRGCADGVLSAVVERSPGHIIYVSCNPSSLSRDLVVLCSHGYRLLRATPYDMHPGTPHIETVALLARGQ